MTVWETLAAVVVGGLLATGGNVLLSQWQARQRRLSLQRALRSEIRAVIEIAAVRGYETFYNGFLERWKAGHDHDRNPRIHGMKAELDPVMAANIERIGDLPPELAEDVVRFYSLVVGIRHDVVVIGAGEVESIQERIALVEEDLRLWAEAKNLGQSLLNRLQHRPWWRPR